MGLTFQSRSAYLSLVNVCVGPYVCIFVQEVEAVLIDSNNTGGVEGGGAAAVDVEE